METLATSRYPNSPPDDTTVDSTPLLENSVENRDDDRNRRFDRRPSLRGAARFLHRASSRRMMREPSMLVRETATEQLEEQQSHWAYSKPIVVLDIIWNLAFVIAAITVMVLSRTESPSMPLRLWIIGYVMQCILHMVCVYFEYTRRHPSLTSMQLEDSGNGSSGNLSSSTGEDAVEYASVSRQVEEGTSVAKHLESANSMFSFVWWIVGFYWMSADGQDLMRDSPQLYWLCITFLAFDVFFVVFCLAIACVIGLSVCCCLPCIIAILYAVADQEGASKEDIDQLPKYKFRRIGDFEKLNGEIQGVMTECDTDTPTKHVLSLEDAECCICLSSYEDGAELRELPCRHHFHSACIERWLYINATCPLCKYNIIKVGSQGREEA
ncbi:hypothetical protein HHK36_000266 [Tetracentron sinense]|uniref:RING-type E3 ubiquitin transferase n=1 Tax=Tetracentron sinense TaxID=13715 RepID=A0A834ZV70_TETSI|nr:hypothetical protein HHK36_000266 [Tetracentron sinense]